MGVWETIRYNNVTHNIVIHCIWAILQSDWSKYSPYISSYTANSKNKVFKNKKKANFSLEKDQIYKSTSKPLSQVCKSHMIQYIR